MEPKEQSVEEVVDRETKRLQQQNQDIAFKLVNLEGENNKLREILKEQETKFIITIGKMALKYYDGK